jgi:DMSO/TMAO reductase YedYZ molybdopterin-dependent catalytic subunit
MINLFKPPSFSQGTENIKNLKNVEIREYQGENFSSISDFRENSIKGPQYINIEDYALNIGGLVDKKLTLTYDEVLNYDKYSKIVTLHCVEGWSVKILWEGVLLKDLLNEARIKPESNTVIFYAYDGYSSSLPLEYIMDNNIILAYKMNGVTIPPERGFPFQVVAENKWGYKWVKWVTKIELSSDLNYKGYWEKSGYNQKGDLKGPIFEE